METEANLRLRAESFGAIVAMQRPPALAYVDQEMARRLGLRDSPLWRGRSHSFLSAPTEVHLSITNACPLRCEHCYVGAGTPLPGELTGADVRRVLEALAGMGVFHIAFGGGEPFAPRADRVRPLHAETGDGS